MLKLGTLDPKWLLLAGGLVAIAYLVAKQAGKLPQAAQDAAAAVGRAIDPTSDQNLAYRGASAAVGAITGTQDETLGGWLYDLTHADPVRAPSTSTPPYAPQPGALAGDPAAWGMPL